ncbi:MAG: DUF3501 family protein [Actinomycetes bacterium]
MSTATDTHPSADRKLTLADISDLREYERERESFRAHIIELKKKRRVSVGPHVTLLFENRDTIRFQIQEMARVEKIFTDEGIEGELRVYNPLIPEPGMLSATLFVELTSDEDLREWLPRLVGVERSVVLRFGDHEVRCAPEAYHEAQLTRDEITASVHYVQFHVGAAALADLERVAAEGGSVSVVLDHPTYELEHAEELAASTVAELLDDLRE